MRAFKLAAFTLAALLAQPAWSAGLTKAIALPDGSIRQVSVLVPEAKARFLEAQGFTRSNAFDTLEKATRHRDQACAFAARAAGAGRAPSESARASLARICDDATQAVAEWK